ncbi:hypothetical protein CYLTODRAFT_392477, partial [Cylindrobasidium torrendii FP15055 ss-10]
MPVLFKRPGPALCHFCNRTVTNTRDPNNFRCPHCQSTNRYDANGVISSYEPAMRDESLNRRSFEKRGMPSMDRIHNLYGHGPFCHQCQTNQMLNLNLMSNYLPDESSPEYEQRLAQLPAYQASIDARYPIICPDCQQGVEERLLQADKTARSTLFGGALKETKNKHRSQVTTASGTASRSQWRALELPVWYLRGSVWAINFIGVLYCYGSCVLGFPSPQLSQTHTYILYGICISSILWIFFDPHWAKYQTALRQGRSPRQPGKKSYITLALCTFTLRIFSAVLHTRFTYLWRTLLGRTYAVAAAALELYTFWYAISALAVHRPPVVRLLDTHKFPASRAGTPAAPSRPAATASEPDLLSALSLGANPIIASPNPVFGQPSVHGRPQTSQMDVEDEMQMDWQSTNGSTPQRSRSTADIYIRPQVFFPREEPTGLEDLIAKTVLQDDVTMDDAQPAPAPKRELAQQDWRRGAALVAAGAVFMGIAMGGPMLWKDFTRKREMQVAYELHDL